MFPSLAAVLAPIHTIQCARCHDLRVGNSKSQSTNGFSMHGGKCFPGFSAVAGAKHVAGLLIFYAPSGDEHDVGILRVDNNVIQYIVVASAEMRKSRPTVSGIERLKQASSAGAEENVIKVARIIREAAGVSTIRSQYFPLFGPRMFGRENSDEREFPTRQRSACDELAARSLKP
jgi:hypothetical protein